MEPGQSAATAMTLGTFPSLFRTPDGQRLPEMLTLASRPPRHPAGGSDVIAIGGVTDTVMCGKVSVKL